jgi:hypothetical protein
MEAVFGRHNKQHLVSFSKWRKTIHVRWPRCIHSEHGEHQEE